MRGKCIYLPKTITFQRKKNSECTHIFPISKKIYIKRKINKSLSPMEVKKVE